MGNGAAKELIHMTHGPEQSNGKKNTTLSTIESKRQTKQTRTETESWIQTVF